MVQPGRILPLCALSVLAFAPVAAVPLPVTGRVELSATAAENIARAAAPVDQLDGERLQLALGAGTWREWRNQLLTTAELSATFEHLPDYSHADGGSFGASAGVRRKLGLGPFAPAIDAGAGVFHRDARENRDDGTTSTASLRVSKRLGSAWRLSVTGDWLQHDARGAMFDRRHRRLLAALNWDVTTRWQLTGGMGRLWGEFTANASSPVWHRALDGALGPTVANYYRQLPWDYTYLYGPDWVSYRTHGRSTFRWLEVSPALARNTALALRYEWLTTINQVGIKYRQKNWTLTLLQRF
ncbi:hypothetical protein [Opitutus terrae]|uniref:DUF560 domain-containing protein n=1 Tax=Opitutus terrae (strain DSM 11246 / JCM 15787 / PB90-1) TaxID=452637 RepID=B1ZMB3_OPITP|nr:hypothetical protein [Opitutus terrae]ACB73366.1 hypothetical protein Oter_0075 [Opitutus terrae PB90-1]